MVWEASRLGHRARLRVSDEFFGGTSIPAKVSGQNLSWSKFTISGPHARGYLGHVFPRFWMGDPCLPAEVRNYSQVLLT